MNLRSSMDESQVIIAILSKAEFMYSKKGDLSHLNYRRRAEQIEPFSSL